MTGTVAARDLLSAAKERKDRKEAGFKGVQLILFAFSAFFRGNSSGPAAPEPDRGGFVRASAAGSG